jgi:hypothetical protein
LLISPIRRRGLPAQAFIVAGCLLSLGLAAVYSEE